LIQPYFVYINAPANKPTAFGSKPDSSSRSDTYLRAIWSWSASSVADAMLTWNSAAGIVLSTSTWRST